MLQRPSHIDSLFSVLTDLLLPETRVSALNTLAQQGFLDDGVMPKWVEELSRRRYQPRYLSGLVVQEKLRVDYALRQVGGELTPVKTRAILDNFVRALMACGVAPQPSPAVAEGRRILDFGAGVWSSLSSSIVLYANGFLQAEAFEPFPVDPGMVTESVFQTVRWLMEDPAAYAWFGAAPRDIKARLCDLDLSGLEERLVRFNERQVDAVSLGPVVLRNSLDGVADATYDYIFSNSVLEHVQDFPGMLRRQHALLKPDGVCVHTIDFSDHRANDGDRETTNSFQLYYDGILDEINGLRPSEVEILFGQGGFNGAKVNVMSAPEGYVDLDAVQGRYRGFSEADLSVVVNSYVLRKQP